MSQQVKTGQMWSVSHKELMNAVNKGDNIADILRILGLSTGGKMYKELHMRADALGICLPGGKKGSVVRKRKAKCTPSTQSVMPSCTATQSKELSAFNESLMQGFVSVSSSNCEDKNVGNCSSFQSVIDQLDDEIHNLEAEIEKRRNAQKALRDLDQ